MSDLLFDDDYVAYPLEQDVMESPRDRALDELLYFLNICMIPRRKDVPEVKGPRWIPPVDYESTLIFERVAPGNTYAWVVSVHKDSKSWVYRRIKDVNNVKLFEDRDTFIMDLNTSVMVGKTMYIRRADLKRIDKYYRGKILSSEMVRRETVDNQDVVMISLARWLRFYSPDILPHRPLPRFFE
jgi:hypothetical protein